MNRAIADRLSREYLFCHTTLEVVAAEDVVRQHLQIYACSESSQWTQTDPSSATSFSTSSSRSRIIVIQTECSSASS
jgi:hypothetical protein